jgi:hypothetical protein
MTLHAQLNTLAATFAEQIIAAIRGASLEELVTAGGRKVSNGRAPSVASVAAGRPSIPKAKGKPGRLPRRSAEEISKVLGKIVLLVKTHKDGMRAEEIRSKLGMQSKEMPRILREGIATKKLTSKGRKRATTYFAK